MFMPQRNDFTDVEITDIQSWKLDKARHDRSIKLRKISQASRAIAEDSANAGWYCLAVMAGFEFVVEDALLNANVHALVPKRKGHSFKRRGKLVVSPTVPVIPGYVLVRILPSIDAFEGLKEVDNVIGVLGGLEKPHRIPNSAVLHFVEMALIGLFDHREVKVEFMVGQAVRILNGPFIGFVGVVDRIDRHRKNRLSVEFALGPRRMSVDLDIALLEKL